MTGTNQALFPFIFAMIGDFGYDAFVLPAKLVANGSVGAAALAITTREKNTQKRSLALSVGVTGVMDITEPAVFGVMINYKSVFVGIILGGAVGGIIEELVSLKQFAVVSPGLAVIPTYIPTDGSGLNSNFWLSIVVLLVSVGTSFVVTSLLEKRTMHREKLVKADDALKILSSFKGEVITIEDVKDPVFSLKMMGDGMAINPINNQIVSPLDGSVVMTTPTTCNWIAWRKWC